MPRIFISYSSQNRELVNRLVVLLTDAGYDVKYDQQIDTGQWWEHILADIRTCDVFLCALSPEYLDSYPCDLEYRYANALNRPLCLIRLTALNFGQTPSHIAEVQVHDLSNLDSTTAFVKLQRALNELQKKVTPLPDPLQPEPPVPLSNLNDVIEKARNWTVRYTKDEQQSLLNHIRPYLYQSDSVDNARYALQRLLNRTRPDAPNDLFADIVTEINALLRMSEPQARSSVQSQTLIPAQNHHKIEFPPRTAGAPTRYSSLIAVIVLVIISGTLAVHFITQPPAAQATPTPTAPPTLTVTAIALVAATPTVVPAAVPTVVQSGTSVVNICNGATINISGSANNSQLCSYVINIGDSDAVKQQKMAQAQQYLGGLVLANISAVDNRLLAIQNTFKPDNVSLTLSAFNQTAMPAAASIIQDNYQRLFDQQAISGLQSVLARYPLDLRYDSQNPSIITSQIDPQNLRIFYDQLQEVQSTTDALLNIMQNGASAITDSDKAHYKSRLNVQIQIVVDRSQTAYFYGLLALNDATALNNVVSGQLTTLQMLQPRILPDKKTLNTQIGILAQIGQVFNEQKSTQIAQIATDIPTQFGILAATLTALPAQTSDTQAVIVGKALSLRELGLISQAVEAFKNYGQWFAASDPTAAQYSQTGQQFTLQSANFGVQFSAAYLYAVTSQGAAAQAGLQVGDIVISYNGKMEAATDTLRFSDAFGQFLKTRTIDQPINLAVLRLNDDGTIFQPLAVIIDGSTKTIGIGFMPI